VVLLQAVERHHGQQVRDALGEQQPARGEGRGGRAPAIAPALSGGQCACPGRPAAGPLALAGHVPARSTVGVAPYLCALGTKDPISVYTYT
jgi:hypothetical protein